MAEENNPLKHIKFDAYVWKARIQPALFTALPSAITIVAWLPIAFLTSLSGLIMSFGGMMFLAQIGRDQGKKKEKLLYTIWGGKPTTVKLRHSSDNNGQKIAYCHGKIGALLADLHLPSADEERQDPAKADQIYEICTMFLRERTRDRQMFPLVFQENVDYGFRRNLWGLKHIGLAVSFVSIAAIIIALTFSYSTDFKVIPLLALSLLINISTLLAWIFWINPAWVRIAADAYADRLIESCERL